jgi:aspartyl-tRNA synthetase
MTFVDLRDRYGITQLVFGEDQSEMARGLGREDVIQIKGKVIERESKNKNIPTGEIEITVTELTVLNKSKTPPFTIEDETDGGEELRMQYRYLDLRRNPLQNALKLRHKLSIEIRKYLDSINFFEIETPYLIKSTPEGARDFVVPSRMNPNEFYALPQSPQTFKQLLMVSGYDRYYQIVRCFRDEDLRADRQPEFTQIDCEMAFVDQEDVLNTFEGMMDYLFKTVKGVELESFPRMDYATAMEQYGSDKPNIRFEMTFNYINEVAQSKGFKIFDEAESVIAIVAKDCSTYTRKELDKLVDFVKRPQVGAKGLIYAKCNEDGTFKSSVDKFYNQEDLKAWADKCGAEAGDLILVLSGDKAETQNQMNVLRLHLADELGLRNPNEYAPLWVYDFPLLEWDEDTKRYHAMHHPFTSPKKEDMHLLDSEPGNVRANAYDLVLNGTEIGGGSIRIHDKETQALMFKHLGFTEEEAKAQFGFLMNAFEYGAPPHGGIALGFDRLCALFGGQETIRDFIAFPKNNSGRDVMIDSPSPISSEQLEELNLDLKIKEEL